MPQRAAERAKLARECVSVQGSSPPHGKTGEFNSETERKTLSDFLRRGCLMGEMQAKSDAQLLRDYAERGHEAAFREIVTRHTDLVYSAALRQLESADLAADVAQSVFVDLARKAKPVCDRLSADASLVGWLHRSTRFAALTRLRDDRRRAAHERLAMEQLLTNSESTPAWEHVRPLLDEALDGLDDADREALLLRYFKNHDLRTVGQALGVSDDAAQKRVSRAVERLRDFFAKRGVTVGASGLTVLISANAVQAAPVGLTATIATGAAMTGTTLAPAATATVTKALAMTAMQKTLVTATVAVLAGAGIYEARQAAQLRDQVQAFQQQQVSQGQQVEELTRERDEAANALAALREENGRLGRDATELVRLRGEVARLRTVDREAARSQPPALSVNDPFAQSVLQLAVRAGELNQYLEGMPDKKIPELHFLSESDWLTVAKDANLQTDAGIRQALSKLRSLAKSRFGMYAAHALDKFIEANRGELPSAPIQLKSLFEVTVSDDVLRRYRMLHTGNVSELPKGTEWVISELAPVDRDYDSHLYVGPKGKSGSWGTGRASSGDPDETWATRE